MKVESHALAEVIEDRSPTFWANSRRPCNHPWTLEKIRSLVANRFFWIDNQRSEIDPLSLVSFSLFVDRSADNWTFDSRVSRLACLVQHQDLIYDLPNSLLPRLDILDSGSNNSDQSSMDNTICASILSTLDSVDHTALRLLVWKHLSLSVMKIHKVHQRDV